MSGEDRRYQVPADGKVHYFFQPLTAPERNSQGFVAGRIIRVAPEPDGSVTSYFAGSGGAAWTSEGRRVNANVPLDLVAIPGSVQDFVAQDRGNIDADASAVFTLGDTKFDENVNSDWRIGGDAITDISIVLDFNRQALDGLPQGNRGGIVIHSSRGRQASFDVEVDGVRRTISVPRSAGCVTLIGEECDRFADQFRRDRDAGIVDSNFVVIPTDVALVRGERTLTWAGPGSTPGSTYAAATPSPSTTGEGDEPYVAPTATGSEVARRSANQGSAQSTQTDDSIFASNAVGNMILAFFSALLGGNDNMRQVLASLEDAGQSGARQVVPTRVDDARPRTEPAPTIQA